MELVDRGLSKTKLLLVMGEWYMKPDGQLPS